MALTGKNISLPIYHNVNGVQTSFHNLVLHKFTVDSVVMSLGDKITGDVYYHDSNLVFTMKEYVVFNGIEYTLVNPPTLVREGMVADNSDLKGMSKYSFEFYHPMYILGNLPFTDVAVSYDEMRYKSQDKTFSWIGKPADYVAKLNKNLDTTEWLVVLSDRFPQDKLNELSEVLSFDNSTIADALKTGYETWGVPFVIDKLREGECFDGNNNDYYSQQGGSKRYLITVGLSSNEILDPNSENGIIVHTTTLITGGGLIYYYPVPISLQRGKKIVLQSLTDGVTPVILNSSHAGVIGTSNRTFDENTTIYIGSYNGVGDIRYFIEGENNNIFIFQFGQGVGLKNNSRTPRNNKIVTRIAGYGSENNIPYGYPQIRWYGDPDATCTIGDSVGAKQNVTINGTTYEWAMSYPIYDGIVGGEWVKLIKHPFTRNHLMPTIYADGVYNKVSQFLPNGSANPNYDPDIEIKDYYDAIEGEQDYNYPHLINPVAPSYEIHEFDDIKPELGEAYILGATPINADLTDADGWDDTMDDNGNYLQSYFKITLPQLTFDIYACAAITQEMQINMRSGACIGCTFTVQVDWEDYKRNFYDSDMNFAPNGQQRDYTRYPDSSQGSITLVVQKDINTFGTLMPNIYQNPHAGDAFVVLGISLPLSYITNAQERLDDAMKSYMLGNNVYYFDYPLKFDEYFLATNTNILNQIRPNTIIRFKFNNEYLELFVKQLTIKFNENTLPQYDITLTDNVEVVLNQIGQVADDVERLGTLISMLRQQYGKNVLVELAKKLSRVDNDTAQGLISFAQGWETLGFFSNNFLGYGAKVNQRGVGEFEEINVRGAIRAAELVFNRISAEEGESIRSIGHGEILTVTPTSETTGIATLKLDGDEWATIDTEDICRGLYNTINKAYDNAQADGVDGNGFRLKAGFFASYFEITSVTSSKGECTFTYRLQDGTTEHPCPLMKFAVYGNFNRQNIESKKKRQSCMYITAVGIAPRLLFLAGVDDWHIMPYHIKAALGNLNGLRVYEKTDSGTELKTLYGDAGLYVEDNIYLGGAIEQFIHANLDEILDELGQGIHAQLLRGSDNIVVDALGNVVGGIYETFTDGTTTTKRYKLHTGVLVYDSGKERYLSQEEFTISYVTDGCDVLRDGNDFYITNIHNTNDGLSDTVLTDEELELMRNTEKCGINFVITTNNGWKTQVSYPVKITHLDTAYINFQLNNEFDSISYRSQLSQYDGLPVTTAIEAYVNGERLEDIVSVTVDSDLFDEPITIDNDSESTSTTVEHDCGLDFTISLDGSLTITRHSLNGTETDLTDAKHQFYISAVAKYAGVLYESGVKTFTLQEITDSTLYDLLLSATAVSKDGDTYTPSSVDVKVQVIDNLGTHIYTENEMESGNIKVRYLKGVYNPSWSSQTLINSWYAPANKPAFNDPNVTTCITVLLVDLETPTSPIILDVQSITINAVGKDGAGQPYVKTNVDSFTIDCDKDGKPLTTPTPLVVDAELYWGDSKCALIVNQCTIKYKGSNQQTTFDSLSESLSASISISPSLALTSSNIEIYLIGSYDGETHTATKTIPVVANRQGNTGDDGDDGRGIVSMITYYKRSVEFSGITAPATNATPSSEGWYDTRIEPTESEPYLWRFVRTTYTSGTLVEQTDAELIYVWQEVVNPNLLDDTEFLSDDDMDAWFKKGSLESNSSGNANSVKDGTPVFATSSTYSSVGYKQYYGEYKALSTNDGSNSGRGYINFLSQYVYKASDNIAKIEAGKWYTLSFYVYGKKGIDGSQDTNVFQLGCSVSSIADTTNGTKVYIDGVAHSSGYFNFELGGNSFTRHTVTFKSLNTLNSDMYISFQMYVREYTQEVWLCKPKLEVGQTATDYRPKRNIDEPVARVTKWEEGKQYYQGKKGEPFLDITAKYNKWYRCSKTHVSKNSNAPAEGSSNDYWEKSNQFSFVATDLLLADQAVINLLFSQKILMKDSDNNLTASINADEHGSYCIYYPESGRKMFEFSYSKNIICYNDDDGNTTAWRLGKNGKLEVPSVPRWSSIYLNGPRSTANNSFNGNDNFVLTKYPQYLAGDTGISAKNQKIYTKNHNLTDGNGNINADNDYIADGWYTSDAMPTQILSVSETDMWQIELMHIESGSITERILITSTVSGE